MIKSMTGYSRWEQETDGFCIRAELKSVNHRYLDLSVRLPRMYSFLEDRVRELVKIYLSRGKADLFISIEREKGDGKTVTLNTAYAESYLAALRQLKETFSLPGELTLELAARNGDLFSSEEKEEDGDQVWTVLKACLEHLMNGFLQMRQNEGERLKADLEAKMAGVAEMVEEIKKREPEATRQYEQRLQQRIQEALEAAEPDPQRLLTEVAIFSEKTAIDEELVRLDSHMQSFSKTLATGGAVGKKLDFIMQEMNREINTIGSKANNLEISKIVIDVKSEFEKIREQIQNIE